MRKKLLIMTIILITILMSSIAMAYCTECSTFGHSSCTQTYWDTNSSGHIRKCCHGYNVMAERVPHTQGQWYTYQSPTNCQTEKIQAWDCTVCGWTHKSYTGTYGPHNWNTTYTNNANSHCYSSVCSVCGATQSEVAHNWNSWTTTSYANCTESGSQQRSCKNSGCSAVQTQVIDALGHSPESYYRYDDYGHRIECIRCYYQFESGPHDMAGWEVVTNPTCTSAGSQKNECRVCDYVKTETIPKLNHNWSDWVITSNPTCTQEGEKERTCSNCGTTETQPITSLGHDWETAWDYDSDEHWHNCSRCNAKGSKNDHSMGSWYNTLNPTCLDSGSKRKDCSVCDYYETDTVPALGHDSGTWYNNPNFHWKKCNRCGLQITVTDEHVWGAGTTVTAPTCTAKGSGTHTCTVCSYEGTYEIDALGHNYNTSAITTPPTCVTPGVRTYYCSRNNSHTYTETIPMTGHTWGNWVTVSDGTCVAKEIQRRTCSVCGATETREGAINPNNHVGPFSNSYTQLDANQHTVTVTCGACHNTSNTFNESHEFGDWVTDTEPTCTVPGTKHKTCGKCNYVQTGTIPAPGHVISGWKTDDNNHWKECTVCHTYLYGPESHRDVADANGYYDGDCDVGCGYHLGVNIATQCTTTFTPNSYVYDGTAKEPTVTVKNGNRDATFNVAYSNNTNAGTATITVTGTGTRPRYYGTVTRTFTITKAPRTGTNKPVASMTGYQYEGVVSTPSVSNNKENGAVVYYYNTSNSNTGGTAFAGITNTTLNVGTYYLYATVGETNNYLAGVTDAVPFTISRHDASCPTLIDKEYQYDGNAHTVEVVGSAHGGTLSYSEDGVEWISTLPTKVDVGVYTIYAKVTGDQNHNDSEVEQATLRINAKPISDMSINPTTFVYDGTAKEPTVTITGLTQGTHYEVSYSNNVHVGNNTAVAVATGIGNYTGTLSKTFSITPATITMTGPTKTYIYGDPIPHFALSEFTITGGQNNEPVNITGDYYCVAEQGSNVGTYPIEKGTFKLESIEGFQATDYTFVYNNGSVTINKRPVDGLICNLPPYLFIYDGTAHEFDDVEIIDPSNNTFEFRKGRDYTLSYNNNILAGENTATVTVTFSENYTGSITKNFTINKRTVTVIPDNKEKIYGSPDPVFTYTTSNNIETPVYDGALTRQPGEGIGSYEILQGTLALKTTGLYSTQNYILEFQTGKELRIKRKPIEGFSASLNPTEYTFDGTYKTPTTNVKDENDHELTRDTDYQVTYLNNFNAGNATAVINGINGYEGEITLPFVINRANITGTLTITGASEEGPMVGDILTANVIVNPTDANLSYKWYTATNNSTTGGTLINGATTNNLTLTTGELGKYIYVVVECSKEPNYNPLTLSANQGSAVHEKTPPTTPVITARLNNSTGAIYNSGTWTNQNVWISVRSEDESRIQRYEYSSTSPSSGFSNMANASDGSANILVNTNQDHVTYYFRATDVYGNVSDVSSINVAIDKDNPEMGTVEKDVTTWTNRPVTVTVSASDALSGINGYYFGTEGTPTFTEIGATHETSQRHVFEQNIEECYYAVRDSAGNQNRVIFSVDNIDTIAPSLAIEAERETSRIILHIATSDSQSGIDKVTVNGNVVELTNNSTHIGEYEITDGGTYRVVSKDIAGNESSYELVVYAVRYSGNGMSGSMDKQLKMAGENITIKYCEFTSQDYEFIKWNTASNGTGTDYEPGDTYRRDESVTLYAQISEIDLSLERVVLEGYEYLFTGDVITPLERVYNNYGKLLQRDEEYVVSYEDNINVGVGKVIITGRGKYDGDSLEARFRIVGTYIGDVAIDLDPNIFVYDGYAKTPKVTVSLDLVTLVNGKDYTLSFEDNVNAGTARAIITGRGDYFGVKEKEFTILKADRNVKAYDIATYVGETLELDYSYEGDRVSDTLAEETPSTLITITSNETKYFLKANAQGTTTIKYTVPESSNYNKAEVSRQVTIYKNEEETYPVYGSVLINDDAAVTNSKTTILTLRAGCADFMYLSETNTAPTVNASGWVDYCNKTPYTFTTSNNTLQIYAWFKDYNGNISDMATDTIIYQNEYNEPAHDSILLDKTPVDKEQPEVEYVSLMPSESTGVTVDLTFKQQDQLVNQTRSGVDNSTIKYGYKEKGATGDYTWSTNNRIANLGFSKNYVVVTQANDRAKNGIVISDEYEIVTPSKYTTTIRLSETFVQADGLIHEILPAMFERYADNEPTGTITYTYYTDRECTHKTTSADGAITEGSAPSKPKTYYVKVTLTNDEHYHDAVSDVGKLHIGWYISENSESIFSYVEETATGTGEYELVVFGSGRMKPLSDIEAYNSNKSLTYWVDFKESITKLSLGTGNSNITSIGDEVFSGLVNIPEIIIPTTVQEIGRYAFKGDSKVVNIISIPGTVTRMGENPFAEVMTPEFEVQHGNNYFDVVEGVLLSKTRRDLVSYPCGKIEREFYVPEEVKTILESAFYGAARLETVIIPDGVERIRPYSFYECRNLKQIEIFELSRNNDTVKDLVDIGDYSFMNIANSSKIYTFNKEIADMFEKNRDYDPAKTTIYWPPKITLHPVDMSTGIGRTVKFVIDAEPGYTEELNYQWYKMLGIDADVQVDVKLTSGTGYTTKQYTTTTLTASNDGDQYYCVVWNMPYYRDRGYAYTNPGTIHILENANYCVERELPDQHTTNEYIFERLQDAFDFAKDDDNIRVLQNVSAEPNATLSGKKKITFTNDGKTISLYGTISIGKEAEVTINGAGTITKDNNYMIENNGILTINNSGFSISTTTGNGIISKSGSKLNIVSGTITAKTNVIYADSAVVNITGENASVIAEYNNNEDTIAINSNNYSKINIEKGTVQALNNFTGSEKVVVIYNNAKDDINENKGRVTVSGGRILASGYGYDTGIAILNVNSADAVITGGEVVGTNSAIMSDRSSKFADINIQGGELSGGYSAVINNSQSAKVIVGVSGGGVTDEAPVITGYKLAILNASKNNTLEFYDGTLKTRTTGNPILSPINGTNSVIIYETLDNPDLIVDDSITDMVYTEEGRYEIVKELGYDIYTRVEGAYNVATLRPDILPVPSQVESQAVTEGEQAEFSFTILTHGHPDVYEFEWQVSRDNGATWNKITTGVGITTQSYKTTPATLEMDGNCYRCVIKSAAGTTYTNVAKLTVYEDISNVDQKPIVRVVYKDDLKQVRYEGTTPCVDMQIIVKSFAEVNSILLSFADENNKEIFDLGTTYSGREYMVSAMRTTKVERLNSGTPLYEYTYTYDLTVYTNGLITVKAANDTRKDGSATQTVDIIQGYKVTYELSPLSSYNDKVLITFISSRKVEPYSSSVGSLPTSDYRKLQSMDGGVYSYRYTYRPEGAMPETKFVFRDDTGNEATCVVHAITRTEYNDVKFSEEGTNEITDLNIIDAFSVAKELEGVIELNENQDAQSRYGLIKSQADVEMAKPRDVGAVDTLSNASSSKTYDGIYIRDINTTQSYDAAYDYARDDRNNYVAAASGLYDTELSNEKGVDNIMDSDVYSGANISGFDENDERKPYMYISPTGNATNIDDEIQDASFRAIIFEN